MFFLILLLVLSAEQAKSAVNFLFSLRIVFCIFSLISIFNLFVCLKEHYRIIGKRIICNYNENLVFNSTCHIRPGDKGHQLYTLEFVINSNIQVDNFYVGRELTYSFVGINVETEWYSVLQAKLSIFQRTKHLSKYKIFIGLNNITLNACALATYKQITHTISEVFSSEFKRGGNFVQPCPWKVHL